MPPQNHIIYSTSQLHLVKLQVKERKKGSWGLANDGGDEVKLGRFKMY
jgi:hypothetical protein